MLSTHISERSFVKAFWCDDGAAHGDLDEHRVDSEVEWEKDARSGQDDDLG